MLLGIWLLACPRLMAVGMHAAGGRVVKDGTLDYRYSQLFSTNRIPTNSSQSWKDQQYRRQYQAINRIGESLSKEASSAADVDVARDYVDCPVWVVSAAALLHAVLRTGQ
jgi:hypothetical protein